MSQPTASLKAFTAVVNRQFNTAYKPNQVNSKQLFDLCAAEPGFVKSFNNNHDGSGALVRRVVGKKAPLMKRAAYMRRGTLAPASPAGAGPAPTRGCPALLACFTRRHPPHPDLPSASTSTSTSTINHLPFTSSSTSSSTSASISTSTSTSTSTVYHRSSAIDHPPSTIYHLPSAIRPLPSTSTSTSTSIIH